MEAVAYKNQSLGLNKIIFQVIVFIAISYNYNIKYVFATLNIFKVFFLP